MFWISDLLERCPAPLPSRFGNARNFYVYGIVERFFMAVDRHGARRRLYASSGPGEPERTASDRFRTFDRRRGDGGASGRRRFHRRAKICDPGYCHNRPERVDYLYRTDFNF